MQLKRSTKDSFLSRIRKSINSVNTSHKLFLLLFVLLVALLRLEPAIHDTVHFSYDQGVDISYVRDLVENHKLSLISRFTGLQGLFMGPLWTWMLTPSYIIGSGNPVANEVWLSILGLIAILYSYAITRHLLGDTEALIVSFYVALSGPFIGSAHIVLSPAPLTILMIFYVWFLWEIIGRNNDRFIPWLGLFAGIFFQFEIGFAAFLFPATAALLIVERRNKRFSAKKLALAPFI